MKRNSGITLIALIVTIIIMLILAAVTIKILLDTGIIDRAQEAADETELAYQRESKTGENLNIGGSTYNNIDEYVEHLATRERHDWHRNGDVLTCSHCNATYNIGEKVGYSSERLGSTTITAEKSGLAEEAIDYGDNSYAVTQTIRADTNTQWIVLGIEDTNKNGKYETLLLTTEVPTDDIIILYGAAAYNNWVDEADRIAKALYGDIARGMTIDDVNECLQCFPNSTYYYTNYVTRYKLNNLTTKLKDLPSWSAGQNGTSPDGNALGDKVLNGYAYKVDYDYSQNTYKLIDNATDENLTNSMTNRARIAIFGDNGGGGQSYTAGYWLASRGITQHGDGYFQFGPGFVYYGYASSYSDFYKSNGNKYGADVGFRAVIPITKELPEKRR